MSDDFELRVLQPGESNDKQDTSQDIPMPIDEFMKKNNIPQYNYDEDEIRVFMFCSNYHGLMSFLLEENFPLLTVTMQTLGLINRDEEVLDVIIDDEDIPEGVVIKLAPTQQQIDTTDENVIPFPTSSNIHNLIKIAHGVNPDEIPKGKDLAVYVQSLKQHLNNSTTISNELKVLIERMPSPEQVGASFSDNESIILFETVNYLWRKITGLDIIDETRTVNNFEKLFGCYLMLSNGLLLHGINHYTIIKDNSAMIITLLDLHGMTFHEYLSSDPERIIAYVIRNGGVRMFINNQHKGFFQTTEEAYAKWAKNKIRSFDLGRKIVKIIDLRVPYNGWNSGVVVKL